MDTDHDSSASRREKVFKKAIAPTVFFAVIGVVLYSVRNVLGFGLYLVLAGVPFFLQQCAMGTVGFWGSRSRAMLLSVLWAIGMQELWIPYLAVTWKRPLTSKMRVLVIAGACFGMAVLHVTLVFLSAQAG